MRADLCGCCCWGGGPVSSVSFLLFLFFKRGRDADSDDRGVTVLVSVFASVGVMRERKMRRKGYAVLGEEIDDADDAESCTQEDFEKM